MGRSEEWHRKPYRTRSARPSDGEPTAGSRSPGEHRVFGPDYGGHRLEGDRVILDVTRDGQQAGLAGAACLAAFASAVPMIAYDRRFGLAVLVLLACAWCTLRWRTEITVDRSRQRIGFMSGIATQLAESAWVPAQGQVVVTMLTPWFESDDGSGPGPGSARFDVSIGPLADRSTIFVSTDRITAEAVARTIAGAAALPVYRRGYRVVLVAGREKAVDPRMEVGLSPELEVGEALPAAAA